MFNLATTPFAPGSDWNTPVRTNATYSQLNWPASDGYNYSVNWHTYSPAVYVASPTDPLVQVSVPDSWGYPGGTLSVHMPTEANGAAGNDAELLVLDGGTVYNFWEFNRTSATTATAGAYGESNVATGSGWGSASPFLSAGTTAAGSSELGGLLVQAETDTGQINHALQLVVDSSLVKPGFAGDAIAGDGGSASGIVQEGDHLAIPPGTPMPSGLSSLGQEVFRALQQYGAYVVDVAGGATVVRAQANGYDQATINALWHDMGSLTPLLAEVTGGTPALSTPTSPSSGLSDGGDKTPDPTPTGTPTNPAGPPAISESTSGNGSGFRNVSGSGSSGHSLSAGPLGHWNDFNSDRSGSSNLHLSGSSAGSTTGATENRSMFSDRGSIASVDMPDIAFSATPTLAHHGSDPWGAATTAAGTEMQTRIGLFSQYAASSFVTVAHASGDTTVRDVFNSVMNGVLAASRHR
ncbi:MAG: hypothetical protein ACREDL_02895 [Bradyrhizobium sp.]